MDSRYPLLPAFRRLALLLVSCAVFPAASAQEMTIRDAGRVRQFELAADEVQVSRKGAGAEELKGEIVARVTGARVLEARDGQARVKLPARLDRARAAAGTDAVRQALPGVEVAPVLYEKGRAGAESARRIATPEILVRARPGQTPQQLRGAGGATRATATIAPGWVMLSFANAHQALAAAERLRAQGYEAEPQLARIATKRLAPNDPRFPAQWHLRNVGQGNGTPAIDANPLRAWDFTLGAGVTVAIVDDGLQLSHPDLAPNALPLSLPGPVFPHHDFNGDDNDPSPGRFDDHGTACAGVAAARGNNGVGVSGAAPEATLLGLRLISGFFTDAETAQALFWQPSGVTVAVSSNSWGPFDDAHLEGPDILARQALQNAAQLGRGGKGVVICWAGGNGLLNDDDVALDGFASSKFVIGVAALTNRGKQAPYSEAGSALSVTAPSDGGSLGITTTTLIADGSYRNDFGGTSSATPLVSGTVALLLAANPALGYRDVKEILMSTAVEVDAGDAGWVENGAGFHFNHKFGAGMIDASAAVARAQDWTPLAAEISQEVTLAGSGVIPAAIPDGADGVARTFDFAAGPNLRVEHVEVILRITHAQRHALEITLQSPQGTVSTLVDNRPTPDSDDNANYGDVLLGWTFMSTHHWGENSTGDWIVRVRDRVAGTTGILNTAQVRLYGTPDATQRRVTFQQSRAVIGETAPSTNLSLRRLGDLSGQVTVGYAVSAFSTATNGADFTLAAGTATFADGEEFTSIPVALTDDALDEGPEYVQVLLRNPTGAALGGITELVLRINDDEGNTVTVTATDPAASEAGLDPGSFTFTRTLVDNSPVTVHYAVSGTATPSADYAALASTVVIPAQQASVSVTVSPSEDFSPEGTELVILTVEPSPLDEYNVGTPPSAQVTIADNDLPAITLAAALPSVPETSPSPVNFTVARPASAAANPLTVLLQASGTAIPGTDYFELPAQVTIPAGEASVTVPMQPKDEPRYRPGKHVILRLAPSADYVDGFQTSARIDIGENDPLPDAKAPAVRILTPRAKARIAAPALVTATGTAADNAGPPVVIFRVNNNSPHPATGGASWTADLTPELVPGPNTLTVFGQDAEGNLSKPAAVTFHYVQPRQLAVSTTTDGTPGGAGGVVTRGWIPARTLEAGQTYTIAAAPAAGFVFAGWSGGLSHTGRSFTFKMPDADTSLVAEFISDLFLPGLQGLYTGPVQAAAFAWESSGMLQLAVTARGACSGSLYLAGARHPLKSEFNGDGRLRVTIARARSTPLLLDLTLDLTGPVRRITGSVVAPDFSSSAAMERAGFSRTVPYPLAATHPKGETYAFVLPAEPSPPITRPSGTGFGTFTIDASGNVKWTATLPDSVTVSGGAPLTTDSRSVLYASLYGAKGLLLGELQVDKTAPASDCTATFDWFKPANPRDRVYNLGFTRSDVALEGSLYTPPAKPATQTVFTTPATTTGTIDLTGGNLTTATGVPAMLREIFTLGLDHRFTVNGAPTPHGLTVKLDPIRGLFSGSFVDAKFPRRTLRTFRGVILQKQQLGWGGFLGGTITGAALQTGTVKLDP